MAKAFVVNLHWLLVIIHRFVIYSGCRWYWRSLFVFGLFVVVLYYSFLFNWSWKLKGTLFKASIPRIIYDKIRVKLNTCAYIMIATVIQVPKVKIYGHFWCVLETFSWYGIITDLLDRLSHYSWINLVYKHVYTFFKLIL